MDDAHFDLGEFSFNAEFVFTKEVALVLLIVLERALHTSVRVRVDDDGRILPRPFAHQRTGQELHLAIHWGGLTDVNLATGAVEYVGHLVWRILVRRRELGLLTNRGRNVLERINPFKDAGTDVLESKRSRVDLEQPVTGTRHGTVFVELATLCEVSRVVHLSQRRVSVGQVPLGLQIGHDLKLAGGRKLVGEVAAIHEVFDMVIEVLHAEFRCRKITSSAEVDSVAVGRKHRRRSRDLRQRRAANVDDVRGTKGEQAQEVRYDLIRHVLVAFYDGIKLSYSLFRIAKLIEAEYGTLVVLVVFDVAVPVAAPARVLAGRRARRADAVGDVDLIPTTVVVGSGDVNLVPGVLGAGHIFPRGRFVQTGIGVGIRLAVAGESLVPIRRPAKQELVKLVTLPSREWHK